MGSETDWISAVCAIVSTVFSLVTLLTVYAAAVQLISQRRIYRLGLSKKALGPWKSKVVSQSRFLQLQMRISTPRVSLPMLVKMNSSQKWLPHIKFPAGTYIPLDTTSTAPHDLEAGLDSTGIASTKTLFHRWTRHTPPLMIKNQVLKEASWVNFLEALDLAPDDHSVYRMRLESEIVNGIVPMRWRGTDLVGICCVLGFQTYEDDPDFRKPMALPMQWSGPLGWMQFRTSSDGCIAEFRRRVALPPQLSQEVFSYFEKLDIVSNRPLTLAPRVCQSLSGLWLKNNRILYLGGTDKRESLTNARRKALKKLIELRNTQRSSEKTLPEDNHANSDDDDDESYTDNSDNGEDCSVQEKQTTSAEAETSALEMTDLLEFAELLSTKKTLLERIVQRFSHINGAGVDGEDCDDAQEKQETSGKCDRVKSRVEVFSECPGLLSTIAEGELADSWGLDFNDFIEYNRLYIDRDEWISWNASSYYYDVGTLRVDLKLLKLIREAVLELNPDGYYFTPTMHLCSDVYQFYSHVIRELQELNDELLEDCELYPDKVNHIIFPPSNVDDWKRYDGEWEILYYARDLCNDFQRIEKRSRADFTIEDMRVVAKATESLRHISREGVDLRWAFIISPELFSEMVKRYGKFNLEEVIRISFKCERQVINLRGDSSAAMRTFKVPEMKDGEFSSKQVLAAFLHVFLTCFWIKNKWISDVTNYSFTIPQSVTMS